jgi:hypothetical protein
MNVSFDAFIDQHAPSTILGVAHPLVHNSRTKETLVQKFCTDRTKGATPPEPTSMDRQATRNAWRLFNLRESPFFQEPLRKLASAFVPAASSYRRP